MSRTMFDEWGRGGGWGPLGIFAFTMCWFLFPAFFCLYDQKSSVLCFWLRFVSVE